MFSSLNRSGVVETAYRIFEASISSGLSDCLRWTLRTSFECKSFCLSIDMSWNGCINNGSLRTVFCNRSGASITYLNLRDAKEISGPMLWFASSSRTNDISSGNGEAY